MKALHQNRDAGGKHHRVSTQEPPDEHEIRLGVQAGRFQAARRGSRSSRTPRIHLCGASRDSEQSASSKASSILHLEAPDIAPAFLSKERLGVLILTGIWLLLGLCAYVSGWVVEAPGGGGLSVVQSLYVMSQIITTVGYGDITPTTDLGMMFSALYILASALIFSGVIMEVLDYLVDQEQEGANSAVSSLFHTPKDEPTIIQQYRGLIVAGLFFLGVIVVWMLFYMFYCEPPFSDTCEGMGVVKAFYFAVVSVCGVGFGDVVPSTVGGELFAAFVGILGLVTYVNLVGAVSDSLLKVKKSNRLKSLNAQDFAMADSSADGSIDLYEFTCFILTRYKIVSADVLEDIKSNFHELDADGSGEITAEDMRILLSRQ